MVVHAGGQIPGMSQWVTIYTHDYTVPFNLKCRKLALAVTQYGGEVYYQIFDFLCCHFFLIMVNTEIDEEIISGSLNNNHLKSFPVITSEFNQIALENSFLSGKNVDKHVILKFYFQFFFGGGVF